jgi:amidase
VNAMAIYSAKDLGEAVRGAVGQMADFIARRTGRSFEDVLMLLSLAGNARICQVVDPLMTARMEVPRSVLADLGIDLEPTDRR